MHQTPLGELTALRRVPSCLGELRPSGKGKRKGNGRKRGEGGEEKGGME